MSYRHVLKGALGALALGVVLVTGAVAAEDKKTAAKTSEKAAAKTEAVKTDASHDAMMAEMMKYASPGAEHKRLEGFVGKWKAVQKSWFAPGEPTVSEGTCEYRMIMGGRCLEQKYTSTFQGSAFEGYGLSGYDNKKKEYWGTWMDNFSTGVMTSTGAVDPSGKEMISKSMGEGMDGKPMEMKMVTKVVDPNTHVFSMFGMMDGKEQLMMEITYTKM